MNVSFLFNTIQDEYGMLIQLCEITMPRILYVVLDPCITALINTYYDALVHFIRAATASEKVSFYHQSGCCSPWLEEIFDTAFKDVFGEVAGNCSRLSDVYQCDDFPTPAVVLKTVVEKQFPEPENGGQLLDNSILLKDSQSEEVRSGVNNRLYAWRNRVGVYAPVPHETVATRMVYIDSCYGYSFDINYFKMGELCTVHQMQESLSMKRLQVGISGIICACLSIQFHVYVLKMRKSYLICSVQWNVMGSFFVGKHQSIILIDPQN